MALFSRRTLSLSVKIQFRSLNGIAQPSDEGRRPERAEGLAREKRGAAAGLRRPKVLHLVGAPDLAGAIVHAISLHRSGTLSVGPQARTRSALGPGSMRHRPIETSLNHANTISRKSPGLFKKSCRFLSPIWKDRFKEMPKNSSASETFCQTVRMLCLAPC